MSHTFFPGYLADDLIRILMHEGARNVLCVGGCVRDHLQGIPCKDVDLEVYGMSLDTIQGILENQGYRVDCVGKTFGILKVNNEVDVSIPRKETKNGVGHKGFKMEFFPDMDPREAALRRDFTINSMAFVRTSGGYKLLDYFCGKEDLMVRMLHPTSEKFKEDPLRLLRGMQFASRFNLKPSRTLLDYSDTMTLDGISVERIWEEWKKWALGAYPSAGLKLLYHCGQLPKQIYEMLDVQQDPEWHPEGCVWTHTLLVCDEAARIARKHNLDKDHTLELVFAALCHDMGKPETTEFVDGRIRAREHCGVGVPIARQFLESINAPEDLIVRVEKLTAEHLVHASGSPTPRVVRRLAVRLQPTNIYMLHLLVEADHSGRPPLPKGSPMEEWYQMSLDLGVQENKPQPILMGRHLLELGVKPGPDMGRILKDAYEAQLDGVFDTLDGAYKWCMDGLAGSY